MNRSSLLKGPLYRAKRFRLLAKFIDLCLVLMGAIFYYPMGLILGIIYLSLADSLYEGQSIGKRFMGFSVISLVDGLPCTTWQSFVRNIPLTLPLCFFIFPFWGWIVAGVFAFPLTLMEVYFLFRRDTAHRLGDVMADTTVIANDGNRLDLRKNKNSWFDTPPIPLQ